jgi:hypothetical protein
VPGEEWGADPELFFRKEFIPEQGTMDDLLEHMVISTGAVARTGNGHGRAGAFSAALIFGFLERVTRQTTMRAITEEKAHFHS